jgi:hypothetical protein
LSLLVPDSRTRVLSLAPPPPVVVIGGQAAVTLAGEPGLADVVTFGR